MALRAAAVAPAAPRLAYRRLLVPLVEGTVSEQAVAIACQLADRGTSVTAVSVIEVPVELPLEAHMIDDEEHARRALSDAAAIGDLYGVAISSHVLRARVAGEAIVNEVREADSELVVIRAVRKRRFGRSAPIFGHTVDFVLKHAPCRVLLVASPGEA